MDQSTKTVDFEAALEDLLEPPVILHWMPRVGITRNIVDGTPTRSLCGLQMPLVDAGADGSVRGRRARPTVICEACQHKYNGLAP